VVNFAEAYARLGCEVTVGRYNFELEASQPDLIHFLWPEELTDWKAPTPEQTDSIIARLGRWSRRSHIVISVNNLYPHRHDKNPACHRLYEAFYQHADVIHHFGHASKVLVCREYPSIADRNHVVRLGFNYDRLLPEQPRNRMASRRGFGFAPEEIVYLVFGSLRSWSEVDFLRRAFSRAKVPRKRLLVAARYNEPGSVWRQRWRRLRWHSWQRLHNVVRVVDYVPDDAVCDCFNAADAVVVIRQHSLSSGIPSLAMTFGRLVIGPEVGLIPEYITGADNLLFDPNSVESLADALEQAAKMDREAVGAHNRRIAAGWGWDAIVKTCRDSVIHKDSAPVTLISQT
jgi:glycosyltransferase involved in cell wall biosynthesis